jgi:hypothetical protein
LASYYDEIDLDFLWNGDFDMEAGDLKDTAGDGLLSLRNELHELAASALGDWDLYQSRGMGLDDYVGEPNTRGVSDAIHDRVRIAIVSAGVVQEEDLEVKVIPVHIHKVLIVLQVAALPSPTNGLDQNQTVVVSVLFDFMEQGIFFLDQAPLLIASQGA